MIAGPELPPRIDSEPALDEVLTRPSRALVEAIRGLRSPLVVVGAGGKMGPTLAVLARRAAEAAGIPLEVIAVSRFTNPAARDWLAERGVRPWVSDLFNAAAVAQLPDSANVVFLVGLKFGTAAAPALTWATNTLVPASVAERYRGARLVALSTGNVYPLGPVTRGGALETDELMPLGEYANAAVARERIFEFCSTRHGSRIALLRLSYAVELRYGVLVDIARKVAAGEPVDVTNGWFNCIWQGDANDMILRAIALAEAPPVRLNLTGPGALSVRAVAQRFGELFERPAQVHGVEANTALLSNVERELALLGPPATPVDLMMQWIAHWIRAGGRLLDKPTHFEVRDGRY